MKKTICIAMASALCVVGCGKPNAQLKPARPAQLADNLESAAVAEVQDVELIAQTGTWPGHPQALDFATPVRLTIYNHGAKPVYFRYPDVTLVGPTKDYAALPVYHAPTGAPLGSTRNYPPSVREHHSFLELNDFYVAHPFHGHHPTLPTYDAPLAHDWNYHDKHFAYWKDATLPTLEMRTYALPEGVLESGGRVSGFVYFERVEARAREDRFSLQLDVRTPGNRRLGVARIPLVSADG